VGTVQSFVPGSWLVEQSAFVAVYVLVVQVFAAPEVSGAQVAAGGGV